MWNERNEAFLTEVGNDKSDMSFHSTSIHILFDYFNLEPKRQEYDQVEESKRMFPRLVMPTEEHQSI